MKQQTNGRSDIINVTQNYLLCLLPSQREIGVHPNIVQDTMAESTIISRPPTTHISLVWLLSAAFLGVAVVFHLR